MPGLLSKNRYAFAITNRYQAKLVVAHVINLESFELLEDAERLSNVLSARIEYTHRTCVYSAFG